MTKLIKQTVGECEVKAFGSFATGLYLPDGDIDVAILIDGHDDRKVYEALYTAITKRGDEYCEVDYIRKSKVPLIKFIKTDGWIQFDVSVNKADGIKQLTEVKKMIDCFPEFRYLAMVLKCMLKIRNLGETYSGGLGSFLLFCMLLVYLREMQSKGRYYTLSEHLLRFMEYYSITNDWSKKRVYVASGLVEERRGEEQYFSFMSPQDPDHDVGKSAFKIKDVFSVFRNRFRMILGKNFKKGESILKELVNPS